MWTEVFSCSAAFYANEPTLDDLIVIFKLIIKTGSWYDYTSRKWNYWNYCQNHLCGSYYSQKTNNDPQHIHSTGPYEQNSHFFLLIYGLADLGLDNITRILIKQEFWLGLFTTNQIISNHKGQRWITMLINRCSNFSSSGRKSNAARDANGLSNAEKNVTGSCPKLF